MTTVACSCCGTLPEHGSVSLLSHRDIVICYQCLDWLNTRRHRQVAATGGGAAVVGTEPIFRVADVGRAVDHYQRLGFRTSYHDETYAFAHRGPLTIHLAQADDPATAGRGGLYLHVDDADQLAGEWRKAGFPKGAMHTHENILANVETVFRVSTIPRDAGPQLRSLVVVPLFHVTGCHSQALPTLRAGGTVVIDAAFDGARMIETLAAERITACTAVPAIYYHILNHPAFSPAKVAGVRWASYGGAPIAPALVHQIGERFAAAQLANGFGLTECTSIATLLPHEWAAGHADSVGFAAPHAEVAIAGGPGAGPGELLIRGQSVCAGYWHNPEATAQVFAEGWLHTGDVGRIGPEGLVYVLDRIKDMINRGGENVYCVEVENALIGAPGVGEVAVVGVPDEMMGEKVGAVIVPLPGATVDPKAVLEYARERLADFKVPQFIALSAAPLPRNPGGKVLKGSLRDTDFGAPLG